MIYCGVVLFKRLCPPVWFQVTFVPLRLTKLFMSLLRWIYMTIPKFIHAIVFVKLSCLQDFLTLTSHTLLVLIILMWIYMRTIKCNHIVSRVKLFISQVVTQEFCIHPCYVWQEITKIKQIEPKSKLKMFSCELTQYVHAIQLRKRKRDITLIIQWTNCEIIVKQSL